MQAYNRGLRHSRQRGSGAQPWSERQGERAEDESFLTSCCRKDKANLFPVKNFENSENANVHWFGE